MFPPPCTARCDWAIWQKGQAKCSPHKLGSSMTLSLGGPSVPLHAAGFCAQNAIHVCVCSTECVAAFKHFLLVAMSFTSAPPSWPTAEATDAHPAQ